MSVVERELREDVQIDVIVSSPLIEKLNKPGRFKLTAAEEVINREDDLLHLKKQLKEYTITQHTRIIGYNCYRLLKSHGFTDEQAKKAFVLDERNPNNKNTVYPFLLSLPSSKRWHVWHQYQVLYSGFAREKFYVDEEELEFSKMVWQDGLSVDDFFKESIRVRQAHIDLFRMQIDWLKKKKKYEKKYGKPEEVVYEQAEETSIENRNLHEILEIEDNKPFELTGWELYATNKRWSLNPNHWEKIPTDSFKQAVNTYARVGRGLYTVQPERIIKGLVLHLGRKDIMQRALDTRSKLTYVKDWIRIREGVDRVGIYIPDKEKKMAVFFSAHRRHVYDGLL